MKTEEKWLQHAAAFKLSLSDVSKESDVGCLHTGIVHFPEISPTPEKLGLRMKITSPYI